MSVRNSGVVFHFGLGTKKQNNLFLSCCQIEPEYEGRIAIERDFNSIRIATTARLDYTRRTRT